MAVSIIGTPQLSVSTGDSYTAESGSNRMLVYICAKETSGNNTAVTFGGNSMTLAAAADASNAVEQSGNVMYSEVWYLEESSIPSGAQTLTITGTNAALTEGLLYTISGAASLVLGASGIDESVEVNDLSLSLPVLAGDLVIAIATDIFTNRTYTWGNLTKRADYIDAVGGIDYMYSVAEESISADSTLAITADVSSTSSTNGITLSAVAFRESAPAISVTQSDTTPEDGVQQSFTTTGLTGTITAATLGGYDILSLLSDTDPTTATTYTLDISAIEASQGAPRIGQTSTLSITATGGTATTDVVIQPKTGWAEVDLAGTLNKDAGGFLALLDSTLGLTSAVGGIIYYDASSNAAITATGVYTSDLTTAGQNTPFVIQQGGSATTVATSEGGAFYPYGESGGGSNVPKTKYRRFPWQPWNPL